MSRLKAPPVHRPEAVTCLPGLGTIKEQVRLEHSNWDMEGTR